jgi:DNA-binding CsgD family transcriptional regulator
VTEFPSDLTADAFRRLVEHLAQGHQAAAYRIVTGSEGMDRQLLLDDEVSVIAALDGDAEAHMPLAEVLRAVGSGRVLTTLRSSGSALSWQAVAAGRRGPSVFILAAYDFVGLLALILDARLHLPDLLLMTTVQGAAARVRKARERLQPDEVSSAVVAAVVEYLLGPDAWRDNGWPLVGWSAVRLDTEAHEARFIAERSSGTANAAQGRERRAALFGGALGAVESEAFGTGLHSPRAKVRVASLDEPIDRGSGRTLGDMRPADGGFDVASAEALDKIALLRALTDRERKVVVRMACGEPTAKIAADLGITADNVSVIFHRVKAKLRDQLRGPM